MPFNLDPALSMMGASQADGGFEGILQILDGIPAERLVQYRHKLSCSHHDWKGCHLLHVMILWSLGREDEARVQLNSFGDDVVAQCLSQTLWGTGGAKRTTPEQLQKDHAKVAQAMAEIYSLLVEEKLCDPLVYGDVLQAFKVSHVEGTQLKGLLDEAAERRGLQFTSTVPRDNFGAPASGQWGLTLDIRSNPVSINHSSPPDNPKPLRSTGSPMSYISSFQISETSIPSDSSCNTGVSLSLPSTGQGEDIGSMPLVNNYATNPRKSLPNSRGPCLLPGSKVTVSPTASPQGLPTPKTPPSGDLTRTFEAPSSQRLGSAPSTESGQLCSSAPVPVTSFGPLLSSSTSTSDLASCSSEPSSSTVPPDDERVFYTFVVLHAAEDTLVACRVKERLEALGVSNGATFSEDFLIPGCGQLNCFQNALDNSAFTLVLLTRNFTGRLCEYQRDTALMDSLTRCCKRNSVIPFVPKEPSLAPGEMPLLLATLVPLRETSPVFDKRVKKTFTAKVIQEKKASWDLLRQIQEREEERERERENLRLQQRLAALNLQSSVRPPMVDMTRMPAQAGGETHVFSPPMRPFVNVGLDQASFSQPFLSLAGSPNAMPGPQLIIQNAQMIQIGDYNHMQMERSKATVGTANETVEETPTAGKEDSPREWKRDGRKETAEKKS